MNKDQKSSKFKMQPSEFIKRDLIKNIREHLDKKEITLIVGPRQVGKTTLMFSLKAELEEKSENVAYLSIDESPRDFKDQKAFLNRVELEIGDKGYVFIDEIQRKENAGLFLKGIYDYVDHQDVDYKFVVSGSGSLELKEKIHESLAGRKIIFELSPIRFKEFVDYKTGYKYENRLKKFFETRKDETSRLFDEYLRFGGYPRIVTSKARKDKTQIMNEILESYLVRDIEMLLDIKRTGSFRAMLEILSGQVGGLVNYEKLASGTGVSSKTLKSYLYYAEKTFCIFKITPFFTNKRKEIVKSPVVYFNDLGLRNHLYGSFGKLDNSKGGVFENWVFNCVNESLRNSPKDLHYWRTQTGAEVDFVVSMRGDREVLPIEVKFSELKRPSTGKSLHSFIDKYSPEEALVVNLSLDETIKVDKTKVRFVSFSNFVGETAKILKL